MSKKSLITAVSTAAMVATLGFAYAQSSDEGAYPNANINGPIDNSVPKHWSHGSVTDNNPYATAAPTAAGPRTAMPADMTTSSTATLPSTDATSPWAADTTSTPPAATSMPPASMPPASSYDTTTGTTPANTTDAVNQSNGSLSTNTAPAETHVDLNSPKEPIYNMGKNSGADSERTPRPDRN